jgi:hypothetical protein
MKTFLTIAFKLAWGRPLTLREALLFFAILTCFGLLICILFGNEFNQSC